MTMARTATALPSQPTRLIGRDADLTLLRDRIARPEVRLLTLTGVGGVGKTRLAFALAESVAGEFADGVHFVDLAPVRDASLVEAAVLRVLGARLGEEEGALRARLRSANALIVLDNFEHVALAAPFVSELLSACDAMKVIVTSRRPLRLRWEHESRISPLGDAAAIDLFVDRATARDAAFVGDRLTVAAICDRLDHLPLAIELAAARVKTLSLAQVLDGLQRPLAFLTDGPIDAPERQRAMRGVIAWSYELLDTERRGMFARMAAFLGGFSADAFAAVAGIAIERAASVLTALVDDSLLTGTTLGRGVSRYRMLEIVREFALERLGESGDLEDVQRAHALHFLRQAEELLPRLFGADELAAYRAFEGDHANLHAALRYFLDADDAEHAARLAIALSRYWHTHGTVIETERWLEPLLARSDALEPRTRMRLLTVAGNVAIDRAKTGRATSLFEEALGLARAAGDRDREMGCLINLAYIAIDADADARALALLAELGVLLEARDDDQARRQMLAMLGWIAQYSGDLGRARELFGKHNELVRRMGSRRYLAHGLQWTAELAELEGDRRRASALTRDALVMFRELGGRFCQAEAIGDAARLLASRGDATAAASLFAASERARDSVGLVLKGRGQRRHAESVALARKRLSDRAFADAYERGTAMDLGRALDLALSAIGAGKPDAGAAPAPVDAVLTKREIEVAELIARGLTNTQIAKQLVIGERTVDTHVENVLHKLDFASRSQVAAWVTERRLRSGGR
ncbi:MAG: hypothetical protein E6J24_04215 [Chloroflexi bacterium]|nr:MAG: hypothetical protein E6J24_04215 [Chloroflexota bacterium]